MHSTTKLSACVVNKYASLMAVSLVSCNLLWHWYVIPDKNAEQADLTHAAQLADVRAMQLVDIVKLSKALRGLFRGLLSWTAPVLWDRVTDKAVHGSSPSCCSSTAQTSSPSMPAASGCSAARLALRVWCAGKSWAFSTGDLRGVMVPTCAQSILCRISNCISCLHHTCMQRLQLAVDLPV